MRRAFLSLILIICLVQLSNSYAKTPEETSKPTKLQQSLEGSSLSTSGAIDENITFIHAFPFTDKRMRANQAQYEDHINNLIIEDLEESKNVTQAAEKYPHDSPVHLTIEKKFAYHVFIDSYGITLYTFSYDLSLDSCGPHVHNLRLLNIDQRKGDIFNLQSVPNKKYKMIIERLIKESSKYTKSDEEQEIPLFITVHPELTFLPAAIIEDKLENLRADFPNSNVRYCTACPNILPFDEYAYLTWLTISNTDSIVDNSFFKAKDEYIINLGLGSKAIFASYPINIVPNSVSSEEDKVVPHTYCLDKVRQVDPFVQNVYYERSLEKFTSSLLFSVMQDASEKQGAAEIEVSFPCYPKYYSEKVDNFLVKGTGNFESCKKEIQAFMLKDHSKLDNTLELGLGTFSASWPLENLKESEAISEAKIYIESEALESLFKVSLEDDKYRSFTMEKLGTQIEEHCSGFLEDEVGTLIKKKSKKEYIDSCVHLIYINSLLRKMGIKKEKELRIKIRTKGSEGWVKGITLRNIELFHNLEKEWFDSAQDRALETYLLKIKDNQELDKQKALNYTFILTTMMGLTFWIGFIVRFRIKEETKDVKFH